jgi:O-antigen biosynthesis protein
MIKGLTSVVIPLYNHAQYVDKVISSALSQTIRPEIIVVNDASTDESRTVIDKYKKEIIIIDLPANKGVAIADNIGIRASQGEYFTNIGSDDYYRNDFVEMTSKILNEMPDIDCVTCDYQIYGDYELVAKTVGLVPEILTSNVMNGSALVRRSLYDELGGFDETMPFHGWEDWDFWIRAYKAGKKSYHIPEVLDYFCMHKNNLSTQAGQHTGELMQWFHDRGRL